LVSFFVKNQLPSTNVQPVDFEEIIFEHPDSNSVSTTIILVDSTQEGVISIEDSIITIDNALSYHYKNHLIQSKTKLSKEKNKTIGLQDTTVTSSNNSNSNSNSYSYSYSSSSKKKNNLIVSKTNKGLSLKYQELPLHNLPNKRLQFSAFFSEFSQGDYIDGKELAAYYWNDKNLNYITRKTISSYIEKNIKKLTRVRNYLIIETNSSNGVDTKISIPLIEKMHIMIEDSATINFGNTLQSKELLFKNALLLPVQTKGRVISNDNLIPSKGFVSGDFYFTEYAASKGGFSLK
jgi:hypothetical protein